MNYNNQNRSIEEFLKIDIRKGTIIDAKQFPEARKPAYKLWIDFGNSIGIKKSSAQITDNYKIENLIGLPVLGVVNLTPRQIGPFLSQVLILGLSDRSKNIILIEPDSSIPDGAQLK